ncbi:MAG: signal peptide peptidase SppA [Gammaproteobacteria bacterium]|jgi:protease-4|nr:signal peptide peptidase SppA [Gammaproteobacteria bacterium]
MTRFLKLPFQLFWKLLKALQTLLFGLIALGLFLALIAAPFSDNASQMPEDGALVLNPSGVLVEEKTAVDPLNFLADDGGPSEVLLQDLVVALEQARDDPRITTLVLNLDNFGGGLMPHLEIVADGIRDFRASGKKVIAASNGYSQSSLLLAAEADEILMNPEYAVLPEGFSAYRTYFSSLLQRLNVTVNLFKVGQYKSAAEPYFQDRMSDEDKQARLAYLNAWWDTYTDRFETARGLPAESLNDTIDNIQAVLESASGNLGQVALNSGWVDQLMSDRERAEYLVGLIGADEEDEQRYRGIGFEDYLALNPTEAEASEHKIAVITAVGSIVDGYADAGSIGSLTLLERIQQARDDDAVKAIVLRVDSGGGSKSASEIIRQELAHAQAAGIPVVASMGSVAASGGYWISATADRIFAHQNTITGSIGIFALIPTFEKVLNEYGVFGDGVATTPLAGAASIDRGIQPIYAGLIQQVIQSGYDQFLAVVAEGRNMTPEAVNEIAQGRVWTGTKALELGLVDEIGGLDEAIQAAAELADITDYAIWRVEPEASRRQQILEALTAEIRTLAPAVKRDPITQHWRAMQSEVRTLTRFNDPQKAYVICETCPGPLAR